MKYGMLTMFLLQGISIQSMHAMEIEMSGQDSQKVLRLENAAIDLATLFGTQRNDMKISIMSDDMDAPGAFQFKWDKAKQYKCVVYTEKYLLLSPCGVCIVDKQAFDQYQDNEQLVLVFENKNLTVTKDNVMSFSYKELVALIRRWFSR